jgi:hypothetical protein
MPAKWSAWKCETAITSIALRGMPSAVSPVFVVGAQSSSRPPLAVSTKIAACRRPPAPNASLVPMKRTRLTRPPGDR